jgi:hypothetical protein
MNLFTLYNVSYRWGVVEGVTIYNVNHTGGLMERFIAYKTPNGLFTQEQLPARYKLDGGYTMTYVTEDPDGRLTECEDQSDPEDFDEHDGYKRDKLYEVREKLLDEQWKYLGRGIPVPPFLAARTEEVEDRIKNIEKKMDMTISGKLALKDGPTPCKMFTADDAVDSLDMFRDETPEELRAAGNALKKHIYCN